jgi:hypothetical protein
MGVAMRANGWKEWMCSPLELARLISWLHNRDEVSVEDVIHLLQRPWNWAPEYERMVSAEKESA